MHRLLLVPTFLSLLAYPRQAYAARSLSARRVRGSPNARAADKYDRSITTFSPEGRLLQLEYALIAAEERGRGLTVCVECNGAVIFAFPSSDDDATDDDGDCGSNKHDTSSMPLDSTSGSSAPMGSHDVDSNVDKEHAKLPLFATDNEYDPSHNSKIHRLSPTQLLLTSGLAGDSRTLASAFRRVTSSWTHINYGEVITARELAKEMGKVRHSIGLRPGARVLGVVGMLIGLDDVDDDGMAEMNDSDLGVEVRMYRSLPGGTMDRCNVCCTGGGADASGNAARKDAMDTLLDVVSQRNDEYDCQPMEGEGLVSKEEQKLQHVIEEVGRVALKYHPDSQTKTDVATEDMMDDEKSNKRMTVDIWLVRATRADTTKETVNSHRYLGKAIMDTIYARRVALDQLSTAAKCLIAKNAKI